MVLIIWLSWSVRHKQWGYEHNVAGSDNRYTYPISFTQGNIVVASASNSYDNGNYSVYIDVSLLDCFKWVALDNNVRSNITHGVLMYFIAIGY